MHQKEGNQDVHSVRHFQMKENAEGVEGCAGAADDFVVGGVASRIDSAVHALNSLGVTGCVTVHFPAKTIDFQPARFYSVFDLHNRINPVAAPFQQSMPAVFWCNRVAAEHAFCRPEKINSGTGFNIEATGTA